MGLIRLNLIWVSLFCSVCCVPMFWIASLSLSLLPHPISPNHPFSLLPHLSAQQVCSAVIVDRDMYLYNE